MIEVMNVERIAVSNQLMSRADKFLTESKAPIGPAAQGECVRVAGVLNTYARALLTGQADLERCAAYVDAADTILSDVVAKRRLIEEIRNEWKRS